MATDCMSCQMIKSCKLHTYMFVSPTNEEYCSYYDSFFLANVFYFMKTISHPLKLCMLNNSSSNMTNSIKRKAHISPCIVCFKLMIAESKDAETCLDITYVKFNGG